ncbi:MAG: glycerol dehydrogenase [Planctomycetota bacterium]|nr:MAG: glycerol dehydrogenase [Planctomycetota bacterium]
MAQVFAGPSRYLQGAGVTGLLGSEIRRLGLEGPVLLIAGGSARRQLGASWERSLTAMGYAFAVHPFGGECSKREIAAGVAAAAGLSARTVLGAGGGKAIDAARAVAAELALEVVSCPTIASTDAPTSAISIVYSAAGVVEEVQLHPRNPALVLVDTDVILAAPKRYLVAGMGDALSTWFEARACARSGAANSRGGTTTLAAQALAELCWNTLLADGAAALAAHRAGEGGGSAMLTASNKGAFERIVEANTLLSGLGFESAGLAAAHGIHNGLTVAPGCHGALHGEKVAFGTLSQLFLEDAPATEIGKVLGFCRSVGLPVTLGQIGLGAIDGAMLTQIATRAVQPGEVTHNEPFPVTAAMVEKAIRRADAAGRLEEERGG